MAFSAENWKDGGESYWCNKTKAELLVLFRKTLQAIEVEHEINRKWSRREDNTDEWEYIHKYQDEFYCYPTSNIANKFDYCVTKDKVEAYLEATQSTPNDPLSWPNDPRLFYNSSLLQSMTRHALEEQCVWKKPICPIKQLGYVLQSGGNPNHKKFEGDISSLEMAYKYKANAENYIRENRNNNYPYVQQYVQEHQRQCACAKQIIELFEKYSNK